MPNSCVEYESTARYTGILKTEKRATTLRIFEKQIVTVLNYVYERACLISRTFPSRRKYNARYEIMRFIIKTQAREHIMSRFRSTRNFRNVYIDPSRKLN